MSREASQAARNAQPQTLEDVLNSRRRDLAEWLSEHAPNCRDEQRHLDAETNERAYWHYGYMVAMSDVLALLGSASTCRRH